MKIWGYWATLGWGLLAFVASQFLTLAIMLLLRISDLDTLVGTPFDGKIVTLFILIANPIMIAIIALAVVIARTPIADYLALVLPQRRYVGIGLGCLVVLIAASDAFLYFSGHPLVTPFQLESYTTATASGWLVALWIGAVIFAPAGEEILFRGFLFRGWARSARLAWPAIIVISILWAALHIQYDWTGILQIFVVGLFLGWMRWVSGSTLLTFFLHALFNIEGTLETVVQLHLTGSTI
jgi:membrane protease YdiL (CAAX protease family)